MAIAIESLRKEFSVPRGVEVAVDSIDLEIDDEEFVTLVGPSGCGKTTTLRCIAGLETATSGQILFDGHDVTDIPANKRGLAMMFQNIALYPHMIIRDNIAYPLKVRGVPKQERYESAERAAEIMQIPELLDKHPGELSGGQRQRAALARTIVQDPTAFLMDEPLSDLDAKLKVEIRKEIQRVHKRVQRSTLYVTHDQEEATTMSDRIAVMNNGSLEQVGTPNELYHKPVNTFVAEFIGNPSMNFMNGVLDSVDNGTVSVTLEGQSLEIATEGLEADPTDSTITVGFRPETVTLDQSEGSNRDLAGTVNLVERIGDRIQATVDGPVGELRAVISADHSLEEDRDVGISIDTERVHIFDNGSGEIIARGTKA